MTTATEKNQKSAADYLDEHWFSLASGGEGDTAFTEILTALNFDPTQEVTRAKTVLSLMEARKDRHTLADKLNELQAGSSGATLKASKAAIQTAREEAQAAEAELDAAYDKLDEAEANEADDKVESLRVTAESLKASSPKGLKPSVTKSSLPIRRGLKLNNRLTRFHGLCKRQTKLGVDWRIRICYPYMFGVKQDHRRMAS